MHLVTNALPDLILLDWMLPGASGIDVAKRLRGHKRTKAIPIIMLSARSEEEDKLLGLETGADDYITKAFSPRELNARINAVLRRRAPQMTSDEVHIGELRLDPVSHRVTARGESLGLGPTELRLLHVLLTHPERVRQEPVGLRCSIAKHRFNINRARASTDFDDFTHVNEAAHIGNM